MQESVDVVAVCLIIIFAQYGNFSSTIPNTKID